MIRISCYLQVMYVCMKRKERKKERKKEKKKKILSMI
jgi:hypothetical protein